MVKNYLVTGGAGFIGANFVKYMLKQHPSLRMVVLDKLTYAGHLCTLQEELGQDDRLIFVQGDIGNRELVRHIMRNYSIHYIVNFAAESHVDRSIVNPGVFLETNILGTQVLLDAAKEYWRVGTDEAGYPLYRAGVKFLQVSTDEVYGSLQSDDEQGKELVLSQALAKVVRGRQQLMTYGSELFTENTPLDPRSPYSASKASADLIVQSYKDTYKLPVNITRCSNNYGPYHYPEKLIPLMIKQALAGQPLPVYGDGKNVRDWLYVEDHAKAIDLVLHQGRAGEVYNVGGFNEQQNITIVRLIIEILARIMREEPKYRQALKTEVDNINEGLITFVQDRLGHDQRYAIDPTKIAVELGWYPETPFEVGIEKTIRWFLEHQDWVEQVLEDQ